MKATGEEARTAAIGHGPFAPVGNARFRDTSMSLARPRTTLQVITALYLHTTPYSYSVMLAMLSGMLHTTHRRKRLPDARATDYRAAAVCQSDRATRHTVHSCGVWG